MKQFSVDELCNHFVAYATAHMNKRGKEFLVKPQNEAVIKTLVLYFAEHEKNTLNPFKGIDLVGDVGTGKTKIMELMSNWQHNKRKYSFISCREIQQDYAINGFQALFKYSKDSYRYKSNVRSKDLPITYCFDDFGAEGQASYYGNKANVMEEVLQDRYREYETFGMLTHMTSNLQKGDVIQEQYGIRVRDRIRGMFNIVEMNGQSFRS